MWLPLNKFTKDGQLTQQLFLLCYTELNTERMKKREVHVAEKHMPTGNWGVTGKDRIMNKHTRGNQWLINNRKKNQVLFWNGMGT